eukprot:jgi/Tetstr1/427424/TSEL_017587.t1
MARAALPLLALALWMLCSAAAHDAPPGRPEPHPHALARAARRPAAIHRRASQGTGEGEGVCSGSGAADGVKAQRGLPLGGMPPITEFPLNLPGGLSSRQLFLTQSSDDVHANGTIWTWDGIAQYLPRTEADRHAEAGQARPYINGHGTVFRINKAPTMYFAHKVGSQTDFRLLNRKLSHYYSREHFVPSEDLPLEKGVTLAMSRVAPDQLILYLTRMGRAKVKQGRQDIKTTMLNNRFLGHTKAVMDSFSKCMQLNTGKADSGMGTPTSGLLLTLAAIHLCDHVTVYGVGDSCTRRAPYQYFQMRPSGNAVHSFATERALMHALADERLIRLCGGDGCVGKLMPSAVLRAGKLMSTGMLVNQMLEKRTRRPIKPVSKAMGDIFRSMRGP